jgi:hypothetical protein
MSFAGFGRVISSSRHVGNKVNGGIGDENLPPTPAPDLSQPNYRRIVADNIKMILPGQALAGELEISGARLVDHLKGPAWLICLELDAPCRGQIRLPLSLELDGRADRATASRVLFGPQPRACACGPARLRPAGD